MASEIRVFVLAPKDGRQRAHIKIGSLGQKAVLLEEFSAEIQAALAGHPEGASILCAPVAGPAPKNVTPAAGAAVVLPAAANPSTGTLAAPPARSPALQRPVPGGERAARTASRHPDPSRQRDAEVTLTRLVAGERAVFSDGETVDWSRLGVADSILGIRPGAVFSKDRNTYRLLRYADDVARGLANDSQGPDIDLNPYSFAGWEGSRPWAAEDSAAADHACERPARLSGRITVDLTAVSPVFIPAGSPDAPAEGDRRAPAPVQFFACRTRDLHGEWHDRFAIPGSSMKGVARSLFEALTNSRAGVSDRRALGVAPLHRRRACQLFIVRRLPTEARAGEVEECRFAFLRGDGQPSERSRLPEEVALRREQIAAAPKAEWRANLFWVTAEHYNHGDKRRLAYQPTGRKLELSWTSFQRWRGMSAHPHFTDWHAKNVRTNQNALRYYKMREPRYEDWARQLFDLKENDLLFGIAEPGAGTSPASGGRLACFGRNVNFVWPSASVESLAEPFLARREEDASFARSDAAELTFGFIADAVDSHSFRGRVRFGTFWLDPDQSRHSTEPCLLELLPLSSPANARAKARPLYLRPAGNGPPDPGDPAAQPRGRKFYWHQRPHPQASEGGIPRQHAAQVRRPDGPDTPKENPPLPIMALPAGAVFRGAVHFTNLTHAELGALLAALDPGRLFGASPDERRRFGVKLGRAKPRGLGSVRATRLHLERLRPPVERCTDLAGEGAVWQMIADADVDRFVAAYRTWAEARGGKPFDKLDVARDLRALLRIPENPSVRVYPARFDQYAVPAGWCNPSGAPSDMPPAGRRDRRKPSAMRLARDVR
jgi:CRISPR-associated protein (TIGR03986 family)